MSQENVTKLREFLEGWDPKAQLEAWERGERDEFASLIASNIAYEDTILPDHVGEIYHGYEGVARATQRWLEPFESITVALERIVGSGERFVSIHQVKIKARHTGIEFEGPLAYLWTFRDAKVIHLKSYANPVEALEAAGLSE
jgi:ketosteroid isomerase-like protein